MTKTRYDAKSQTYLITGKALKKVLKRIQLITDIIGESEVNSVTIIMVDDKSKPKWLGRISHW